MVSVGEPAPAFTMADQAGIKRRSEEFAGSWTLLYWYPKADTPGCAAQAQGLRDNIETFKGLGCTVLGASFDTVDEIAAFHEKYRLNFPLLADPERSAGIAFGVAGPSGEGTHASRTAFLISPSGRVNSIYDVEDPEFFADVVLDDLEEVPR